MRRRAFTLFLAAAAACSTGESQPPDDTGLDGLALVSLSPGTLVPSSRVVLDGRSFVDTEYGTSRLRLTGTFDGSPIDVTLPVEFIDYGRMELAWPGGAGAGLPSDDGTFDGDATIEVDSMIDGETHTSAPLAVSIDVRSQLEPRLDLLQTGVIFVNDPIVVEGDGFLLGDEEGTTYAVVSGCFRREGTASCVPVPEREVPLVPASLYDRTAATFAFDPRIAGIHPGTFDGMVQLVNRHADTGETTSAPELAAYDVVPPLIFQLSPTVASLGQYVEIRGGGFVGLPPDSPDQFQLFTTIELAGTFTPTGGPAVPVDLTLVPEFVSGPLLRYVLSEDDDLGMRVDLRAVTGTFEGTVRPIIQSGADTVTGDPTAVTLGIGHVKQVVWLRFLPSYVESLRHFGLRAMETQIRERVLEVARRDYEGVNVEFRTSPPTDFALYATVDLAGPDPNGLGLLGYDNSPGKDTGNQRLYDKIGGVNATTQEDGYPGYGGVFVESFFGFSEHPGDLAEKIDGADPLFDQIFDPFRPDRDGRPVLSSDLAGIPASDPGACPAQDRPTRIACAVWVLGSMIGTTMTHEVGHSLGLANPDGEGFHNPNDQPDRLMDSGGARTFPERAELMGQGPARFCDEEYAYLRDILPSEDPASTVPRPSCY
jgi:hypothetical protein